MKDPADMKCGKVDLLLLGKAIFRMPLIAAQLGHSTLEDTATYLHPADPATEFAVDLLYLARGRYLTTEEFADKWFDGMDGAIDLLKTMTIVDYANELDAVAEPVADPPQGA